MLQLLLASWVLLECLIKQHQIHITLSSNPQKPRKPLYKIIVIPSLKPVLKRRGTWRRYLIRPVPVVFLLIAFKLQLSTTPNNQSNTQAISQVLTMNSRRNDQEAGNVPNLSDIEIDRMNTSNCPGILA